MNKNRRDLTQPQYSIQDLLGKVPDNCLAKMIGVSRERVRQWRKDRGIPRCYYPQAEKIEELLETKSVAEVSSILGIHPTNLYYRKRMLGIVGIVGRKKHDWPAIKADYDAGMRMRELERKYGLCPATLSRGLWREFGIRRWKQQVKKGGKRS